MLIRTDGTQKAVTRFLANLESPVTGLRLEVTGGDCFSSQSAMNRIEEKIAKDLDVPCDA